MTDACDVVAAFVDGEPVAAEDLSVALGDSEAREYLIDILALRGLVQGERHAIGGRSPVGRRRPGLTRARLTAVAALFTAAVATAFYAGRSASPRPEVQEPFVEAALPPGLAIPAPPPTQVIKLEAGRDWNERTGGN